MLPIRVLLVDDHPVVRFGIRTMLEAAPDVVVIGEAKDGYEAVKLANDLSPDVLLLDMEIPGIKGTEVVQQLKTSKPGLRILVLSGHDDKQYIREILANGVAGYLMKDEVPEMILDAIRGAARGESGWISRRVAMQIASAFQEMPSKRIPLTRRETEVLREIVGGKTNKDISLSLKVSEKMIEKHLISIFSKLGVASRVEAAVYALRQGWFE